MARNSEREIYDGCSRPRLTPLAKSVEIPLEAMRLIGPDTLKGELQRQVVDRVWKSVDWGMQDVRKATETEF